MKTAHPVGWECPNCHSVYAPHVFKCPACPRTLGERMRAAGRPRTVRIGPVVLPWPEESR